MEKPKFETDKFLRIVAMSHESARSFVGRPAAKVTDEGAPHNPSKYREGARLYFVHDVDEVPTTEALKVLSVSEQWAAAAADLNDATSRLVEIANMLSETRDGLEDHDVGTVGKPWQMLDALVDEIAELDLDVDRAAHAEDLTSDYMDRDWYGDDGLPI